MVTDYCTNMNKSNAFFSEILQQIHKIYDKVAINNKIWHIAKSYFTSMRNTWYPMTVQKINKIIYSVRYHNKHSKFMKK